MWGGRENEGSNGMKRSEERKAEKEEETVQWVRLFWQVGGCGGGDMSSGRGLLVGCRVDGFDAKSIFFFEIRSEIW